MISLLFVPCVLPAYNIGFFPTYVHASTAYMHRYVPSSGVYLHTWTYTYSAHHAFVCVATSRLLKCSRIMITWASQVAGHSSTSNSCSCSHFLVDVSQPQNRLRQTMRSMYGLLTNQLPPPFFKRRFSIDKLSPWFSSNMGLPNHFGSQVDWQSALVAAPGSSFFTLLMFILPHKNNLPFVLTIPAP